jgi:hypothetical protein
MRTSMGSACTTKLTAKTGDRMAGGTTLIHHTRLPAAVIASVLGIYVVILLSRLYRKRCSYSITSSLCDDVSVIRHRGGSPR